MGLITDEQLAQALGEQMGMQVISLAELVDAARGAGARSPSRWPSSTASCRSSFEDNTLTIAMCDPQKLSILDELRSFLGYDMRAVVATEKDVLKALERYYAAGGESVETLIADMEQDADAGGGGRRPWRRAARWT